MSMWMLFGSTSFSIVRCSEIWKRWIGGFLLWRAVIKLHSACFSISKKVFLPSSRSFPSNRAIGVLFTFSSTSINSFISFSSSWAQEICFTKRSCCSWLMLKNILERYNCGIMLSPINFITPILIAPFCSVVIMMLSFLSNKITKSQWIIAHIFSLSNLCVGILISSRPSCINFICEGCQLTFYGCKFLKNRMSFQKNI